jgi:hypothetical protein
LAVGVAEAEQMPDKGVPEVEVLVVLELAQD